MDFEAHDTRLAAYAAIVDERDRLLLALWNEGAAPQWTMPGGGVELHETPAEPAVRELAFEVGGTTDAAGWLPLAEVPTLDRVALVVLALALPGSDRGATRRGLT